MKKKLWRKKNIFHMANPTRQPEFSSNHKKFRGHQGEGVAASVKRLKPHTTTTSFFLSAIHQLSLEFLDLSVSLSAGGESAQDMTRAPSFGSKPSSM